MTAQTDKNPGSIPWSSKPSSQQLELRFQLAYLAVSFDCRRSKKTVVTTQYAIKGVRSEARSYVTNVIDAGRSGVFLSIDRTEL
jgi:hypothetical protein